MKDMPERLSITYFSGTQHYELILDGRTQLYVSTSQRDVEMFRAELIVKTSSSVLPLAAKGEGG